MWGLTRVADSAWLYHTSPFDMSCEYHINCKLVYHVALYEVPVYPLIDEIRGGIEGIVHRHLCRLCQVVMAPHHLAPRDCWKKWQRGLLTAAN